MRLTHFMICIPGIRALRLDSTGKLSRWLVTEHLQQFYLGLILLFERPINIGDCPFKGP